MVISSSTGDASSGSSKLKTSSSEEDLQQMRKRKRMVSNRESARRSRMRKQKHLDELTFELSNLRKENNEIATNMNLTSQLYVAIEAENSVLRAQTSELSLRLDALNDIINRQERIDTPRAVIPSVSLLYPCSEFGLRLDDLNDIINRQESTNTLQAAVPAVPPLNPCVVDDQMVMGDDWFVNCDWNFNFQGINQQHPMIDMVMY